MNKIIPNIGGKYNGYIRVVLLSLIASYTHPIFIHVLNDTISHLKSVLSSFMIFTLKSKSVIRNPQHSVPYQMVLAYLYLCSGTDKVQI